MSHCNAISCHTTAEWLAAIFNLSKQCGTAGNCSKIWTRFVLISDACPLEHGIYTLLLQTGLTRQRHALVSQIMKSMHSICSAVHLQVTEAQDISDHQEVVIIQLQS